MSHLDEGTLHALLDGELETTEVAEIQAHLGSCSACGLRLREVKEFLGEADRLIASVNLGTEVVGAASLPAQREAAIRPDPIARPEPPARREPVVRAQPAGASA
ncbi:MAG: zf-HC2 domain-containing protein, partial [Gemmatimonadota bacterium]|nr:zf-HC2 domain-containing protein [Gemmatimonadota bacterium]